MEFKPNGILVLFSVVSVVLYISICVSNSLSSSADNTSAKTFITDTIYVEQKPSAIKRNLGATGESFIEKKTLNPTEDWTPNPTKEITRHPTEEKSLKPTEELQSFELKNVAAENGWSISRTSYSTLPYFETDDDYLKYSILAPYRGVIEPNAKMRLHASDLSDYDGYSSLAYTVCPVSTTASGDCEEGTVDMKEKKSTHFKVDCTPFDEYQIDISVTPTGGQSKKKTLVSFKGLCLYVRREIRQLSPTDLNATLDAMATLWFTSDEQGQALYGSNFHNITYFTRAHYFASSFRNADHMHEGLGFLAQHLKLSNAFELALQAVDKSLTLPYWDYTMDYTTDNKDTDYFMFQASTFGGLPVPNEDSWTYGSNSIVDARIPDGRWKDLKIEAMSYFPEETIPSNIYGVARAPWNFNPSPYLSRFSSSHLAVPSCKTFRNWLEYDSLDSFMYLADTSPHTGAHDSVGGAFGCDEFDFMKEKGWADDTASICFKWGTYIKDFWREYYISPNSSCTPSENVDSPSCGFYCEKSRLPELISEMQSTIKGLNKDVMTTEDWERMQKFVCDGGGNYKTFFGDQRESASPHDPAFWPIHPTLERAYHAKMLVGGFTKSSVWGAVGNAICYRSSCYNDDGVKDQYEECCIGHSEDDRFPNFLTGVLTDEGVWQTNAEYFNATEPTSESYSMSYIYDSFSWEHCGDGTDSTNKKDVDALLKSLYDGTFVDTDEDDTDDSI